MHTRPSSNTHGLTWLSASLNSSSASRTNQKLACQHQNYTGDILRCLDQVNHTTSSSSIPKAWANANPSLLWDGGSSWGDRIGEAFNLESRKGRRREACSKLEAGRKGRGREAWAALEVGRKAKSSLPTGAPAGREKAKVSSSFKLIELITWLLSQPFFVLAGLFLCGMS